MDNQVRKLICKELICEKDSDLIKYEPNEHIVLGREFNVFNIGDVEVKILLNDSDDMLILEPGEGFDTRMVISHAIVKTEGAMLKYSYWK